MTSHDVATIARSFPKQVKRSTECTQNSTYTTSGSQFFISCDSQWAWWDALYITFTPDFQSCMNACVVWNLRSQDTCTGVSWSDGSYGPSGVLGGSECTFYWATTNSFQTNGTYSGQLQTISTPTTTSSITSTLPVPQPTATECASKNATGYVIGADKFDLFCDINWAGYDMYLNFTRDFFSCMDGCVRWNENATEVCVGVAYSPQNYGPRGLAGGTQCFYKWTMPNGQEASFVGLDNARLNLTSPGSSTTSASIGAGTATISTSTRSTATTTSALTTNLSHSQPYTGAIVGGVVSGVIVLAFFVLFALFLFRRRRRTPPIPFQEISCGKVNYTDNRVSEPPIVRLKYLDVERKEADLPGARLGMNM